METNFSEVTTTATLAEKKKLRNGFRRFDMICYTVVAVIVLNALGAFASNGTQAFTWLVISAINFSALRTAGSRSWLHIPNIREATT